MNIPEQRRQNLWVLHEDGTTKIALSPEFVTDGSTHRHWRRVKAVDGNWYDHVGEDASGRWLYRDTDHNINDFPIVTFGPHHIGS